MEITTSLELRDLLADALLNNVPPEELLNDFYLVLLELYEDLNEGKDDILIAKLEKLLPTMAKFIE